jgi:hypothetical protein
MLDGKKLLEMRDFSFSRLPATKIKPASARTGYRMTTAVFCIARQRSIKPTKN